MKIRKTFFWLHLILGCSAALFVLLMSITGVALTYERQMIKAAERADYVKPPTNGAQALTLDNLIIVANSLVAEKANNTGKKTSITLTNELGAPVVIKAGRKVLAYLNPYTADEMVEPGKNTKIFFKKLRGFHRWLTLDGTFSETGRWINGVANVFFFILLLTGIYLWFPKRFKVKAFKQKLTISSKHASLKARDYQWHNVFGFYMSPILFIVIVTAFFFSFKWPGQTLKRVVSSESIAMTSAQALTVAQQSQQLSQQALITALSTEFTDWQSIQFLIPTLNQSIQIYQVDNGNGGEPQKKLSVALSTLTGEVVEKQTFDQASNYRQVRSYIRFLHTGEAFGLVGQTLVGLASLLACLLVYTGVMLSWRRWQASRAAKLT